jgi:hypothetical protein
VDRGDDAERPPTTRIGPAGGAGRGLSTVVALVALALVVAVLKPWDWFAPPAVAPGREGAAIPAARPAASPTVAPTPVSRDWTGAGPRVACLSGTSWLAVVDQVDGPTVSRSWTRLDPVPATDPLDAAIPRTHVYADSVPRIGFCAPSAVSAPGAADTAAGGAPFLVRAWQLPTEPAALVPQASQSQGAAELAPVLVSGGTTTDGGGLYGPAVDTAPGTTTRGARDPEGAWAARGSVPHRGTWAPGDGMLREASWSPGTYVFRVLLPDAGWPSPGVAWFAIELRGPWTGPEESPTP